MNLAFGVTIASSMGMPKFEPAALAVALLVLACAAPALAGTDSGAAVVASPEFVTSVFGLAERVLGRLPESGALLLWGTGLAAASKVVSRKPDANK